ncbi:MAG: hypothetical protein EAZ55_00630 [Cytophagales bacterium]|nr:MAG: hypothetical protein EAZ55_00630 [Cytophagales bacterium]
MVFYGFAIVWIPLKSLYYIDNQVFCTDHQPNFVPKFIFFARFAFGDADCRFFSLSFLSWSWVKMLAYIANFSW